MGVGIPRINAKLKTVLGPSTWNIGLMVINNLLRGSILDKNMPIYFSIR